MSPHFQVTMCGLGIIFSIIGLVCALQSMGPEPEIAAAEYQAMKCGYWPDLKECRTETLKVARN